MFVQATSGPMTGAGTLGRRVESWKEIAAYLGRDVTTVRRWEKREGLPVHRLHHNKLGSVYAYTRNWMPGGMNGHLRTQGTLQMRVRGQRPSEVGLVLVRRWFSLRWCWR